MMPDLAACLDRIRARNARRFVRDALQLFQSLDVVLDVLAACARTGGGDRVGCLNQAGNNGLCLDVAVMRLDGVNDRRGFLVLFSKVYADLDMAALDLVVDRLADVMQQACAARLNRVETQLARHHAGDVRDLDRVLKDILAVGSCGSAGGRES